MIEGLVKDALENARGWIIGQFTDAASLIFAPFLDPLNQLYAMGALCIFGLFVIGWFFPFKWIRAGLGFVLMLIIAYIAGARGMYFKMKERTKRRK